MKKVIAFLLIIVILISICFCSRANNYETISFDKKNAKVIAHRGLSGLEIENTEEAFEAAGERSYYGIEADVRRTADNKFVICHDDSLKKVAGVDIKVEESTLEELMQIELKPKRKGGESGRLCELGDYISICKNYSKQAILELKSKFTETEISQIIEIINSYGYLDSVTFISFDYASLEYIRELLPEQEIQFLFSKFSEEILERLTRDKIDAGMSYKELTKDILSDFHEAGLKVNCWTVDNKTIAEQLADLGVDYITTNILE
jgi:glycerophosphoryl diester phosphodiesterase